MIIHMIIRILLALIIPGVLLAISFAIDYARTKDKPWRDNYFWEIFVILLLICFMLQIILSL